jgi:hypothetical protein
MYPYPLAAARTSLYPFSSSKNIIISAYVTASPYPQIHVSVGQPLGDAEPAVPCQLMHRALDRLQRRYRPTYPVPATANLAWSQPRLSSGRNGPSYLDSVAPVGITASRIRVDPIAGVEGFATGTVACVPGATVVSGARCSVCHARMTHAHEHTRMAHAHARTQVRCMTGYYPYVGTVYTSCLEGILDFATLVRAHVCTHKHARTHT